MVQVLAEASASAKASASATFLRCRDPSVNRDDGRHVKFDTQFLLRSNLQVTSHHAWFAVEPCVLSSGLFVFRLLQGRSRAFEVQSTIRALDTTEWSQPKPRLVQNGA